MEVNRRMDEERQTDQASAETQPVDNDQNIDIEANKPAPWLIIGFVAVALLIIAGLFLPPISLGQRLGLGSNNEDQSVTSEGDTTGPQNGFSTTTGVAASEVAVNDLAGAGAGVVPTNLTALSNGFVIDEGSVGTADQVSLNMPSGANSASTDMFAWNGSDWVFVPSTVNDDTQQIVSHNQPLHQAYLLAQTGPSTPMVVNAEWNSDQQLAQEVLAAVTEISVGPLNLASSGDLQGEINAVPAGTYGRFLRITNVGSVIDQASLSSFLSNPDAQTTQIDVAVNAASSGGFNGINVDFQGVSAAQGPAYSDYISQLADALHAQGLQLAVTLATPQFTGASWDSGGQDWASIGQSADTVHAQMPLDPTAYTANSTADTLLGWATRQVDRRKLVMMVDSSAVDRLGESFTSLSNDAALANFGELQFTQGSNQIGANSPIEVVLSGNATPLEWDGAGLTYKYSYDVDGQTHFVWLSNPAALAQRLSLAKNYNLRGVAVRGLGDVADGPGFGAALASATGQTAPPEATGAAIVWTVRDAEGSVLASESGNAFEFAWDGGNEGSYELSAEFALGNTIATLDSTDLLIGDAAIVAEETAAENAEDEEEDTAVAATDTSEETAPEPTPEPTAVPQPPSNIDPGSADAVVNTNANIRLGPGLSFGTIAGGANAGTTVSLIGRTSDNSWYQLVLPDGQEGWIFGNLLTVNSTVDLGGLEVVEVESPVGGGGAPPPPAPVSGLFELGGQSAGLPVGPMQISGMTWIKRQHKWSPGNSGSDVQGLISEGHAAGFKVLLSIPGQLNPTGIDFAAYTVFLGQVAALADPPDAIEVWNEMNITREWPAGQINPTTYVNSMLKPAYTAIKAANPNVIVITGAPAPTGFFGGSCGGSGCDDAPYIAGMMAAGAGSFSDCVGVHYNEGVVPPSWTSGDPRGSSSHYTRYYQGMVDAYVGAGAGSLCFTELGYLSGEEWGFVPGGFLWKPPFNLTVAEQAQFLAEAVSLAANSGRVRLLIIFNVDFTTWGDDPQAGYAMVRPNGGCPACETVGNVMSGQ